MNENEELTLDKFGEIMDRFLTEQHIAMLIDMPEGTLDATIKDNIGLGPVIQFYIMLQAIPAMYLEMEKMIGELDDHFIDATLDMIRNEIKSVCTEKNTEEKP